LLCPAFSCPSSPFLPLYCTLCIHTPTYIYMPLTFPPRHSPTWAFYTTLPSATPSACISVCHNLRSLTHPSPASPASVSIVMSLLVSLCSACTLGLCAHAPPSHAGRRAGGDRHVSSTKAGASQHWVCLLNKIYLPLYTLPLRHQFPPSSLTMLIALRGCAPPATRLPSHLPAAHARSAPRTVPFPATLP